MKIGIVLHPYDEDKPAGLGRTIFELVRAMLQIDEKNEYIIFVKNKPRKKPRFPGKNWQLHVLGEGLLWLDRLRSAPRADVYIFNTPVLPLFWRPPKSIVIVLDFAYRYLPTKGIVPFVKNMMLGWYHGVCLRRADHIVSISETTKKEVIKLYKIPKDKITVVYLGYNKICVLEEKKINVPQKFFLFVGVLKDRKNPFSVIKAFVEFYKKHKDFKLVVAGRGGGPYYHAMVRYVKDHNAENAVVFLGFVSDEQLSFLYKRAYAFVFPSLFEGGFALPIFESMDCGVPVIASGKGPYESMEETVGDAGILVDPLNISQITSAMERLAEEAGLREEFIKKGFEHVKKFSWRKTGEEMLKVVSRLESNSNPDTPMHPNNPD